MNNSKINSHSINLSRTSFLEWVLLKWSNFLWVFIYSPYLITISFVIFKYHKKLKISLFPSDENHFLIKRRTLNCFSFIALAHLISNKMQIWLFNKSFDWIIESTFLKFLFLQRIRKNIEGQKTFHQNFFLHWFSYWGTYCCICKMSLMNITN